MSASSSVRHSLANQYTYTGPNPSSSAERMQARVDRLTIRTVTPFFHPFKTNLIAQAMAHAALKDLAHPLSWNIAQKLR